LVLLPFLVSCQTPMPAMPVDEAKHVAASFSGSAFVPPPSTIDDLTASLDQQPRANPAAAERARARADEPSPSTNDDVTLRRFYYRRGRAAFDIGRMQQAIDDLTKASTYPPSENPSQYTVFDDLRFTHSRAGNSAKALEYARLAAAAVPNRGNAIIIHVWLMNELLATGDIKAAEGELKTAERLYTRMRTARDDPMSAARRQSFYLRGEASMAAARGQYQEAERLYRELIALQLGE